VPDVSVIVPVRDAAATLPALLDALAAQTHASYEVVAVDDASRDGTAAVLRDHPLRPRVVRAEGAGSYAARNAGLAVASGAVVAFTDADCVPSPSWLSAATAELGPREVLAGQVRQRQRPGAGSVERYDRATYLDQRDLARQGFAATANLITHSAVLRELGGFDGTLRSSGDRELGHRLSAAGIAVRYCESAWVEHEPRTTLHELWQLHRRLGRGWGDLHRRGTAPAWWREGGLRIPLGQVVDLVAEDGPPMRRRGLLPAHAVAMTARWTGRLLG
jgi:glycosyltransferase involved in cell wall biosynthesis